MMQVLQLEERKQNEACPYLMFARKDEGIASYFFKNLICFWIETCMWNMTQCDRENILQIEKIKNCEKLKKLYKK